MQYAFLGHQPELSQMELETLVGSPSISVMPGIIAFSDEVGLMSLADKLGGTVKIASLSAKVTIDQVPKALYDLISVHSAKNVAISNFTDKPITQKDIHDLKESLVAVRPIRFVSFDDRDHELLMLKKKHVAEFNLIPEGDSVVIAETVWIFDSLGFAARDRKKPYQDIKRGMLPVKIARIMVNLAVQGQERKVVLDPFCGTGTVLSEAIMVGSEVIGSDVDHLAVSGAETNLSWLSSRYNIRDRKYNLFVADATHVDEQVKSVNAIVTEPLMGPLLDARRQIPEAKVKNVAKGLDKLYRGALKSWLPLLPAGGRVVITLPVFQIGSQKIETISVDTIRSLGYNYLSSVAYSKPGATVIRNITILEKPRN